VPTLLVLGAHSYLSYEHLRSSSDRGAAAVTNGALPRPWRMGTTASRLELDYREGDGIAVTLSWDCAANRVIVRVLNPATGESFELTVEDANARDAFEHPFAYAAFRGMLRHDTQRVAA